MFSAFLHHHSTHAFSPLLLFQSQSLAAPSSIFSSISSSNGIPQLPTTITNPETSPSAEADVAFKRAVLFEKSGQARSAHAHFHEAATLYQCFLDTTTNKKTTTIPSNHNMLLYGDSFAHVTAIDPSNPNLTKSTLSYACARLAHLSGDALGDDYASYRLYGDAIRIDPERHCIHDDDDDDVDNEFDTPVDNNDDEDKFRLMTVVVRHATYYDGMGTAIESACGNFQKAIEAYRHGLSLLDNDLPVDYMKTYDDGGIRTLLLYHLAVALERLGGEGNMEESTQIFHRLRTSSSSLPSKSSSTITHHHPKDCSYLVDSWGYVRWHTRRIENTKLNIYLGTRSLLQIGIEAAMPLIQHHDGHVCEFGVGGGRSLRMIQEILPLDVPLHGFDAFGSDTTQDDATVLVDEMPKIPGEVYFYRGLFVDTIPKFLAKNNNGTDKKEEYYQPLAFANVDCDSYGSTLSILERMHSRVVPGTVLCFDEYLCHPTWRKDEFRAWRECCKRFGWQYEYLGFSFQTKQAVVRVTSA